MKPKKGERNIRKKKLNFIITNILFVEVKKAKGAVLPNGASQDMHSFKKKKVIHYDDGSMFF
tara:strand:+ start:1170 stop:1355 length:186 start_codon:yes stop_codon:yes gene_type:complete